MPSLTKVQTGFLEPQGAFTLDPGTASAPGLRFSTSAATGMFSPSTGVLGFSTGSTQNALTILSSGNVGIGTTTPQNVLDLGSATNNRGISWGGAGANYANIWTEYSTASIHIGQGIRPIDTSTGWVSSTGIASVGRSLIKMNFSTGDLSFHTNTPRTVADGGAIDVDPRLTISGSGNIGIGITNPTYKLEVYSSTNNAIRVVSTAGVFSSPAINIYDTTHLVDMCITPINATATFGSYSAHPLAFYVGNLEKARISPSGTLSINTQLNPTIGGFSTPQLYIKSTASNWTGGIHIEEASAASVGVINHSSEGLEISQSYRASGSYKPIIFRTAGAEIVRIGTSGNVGIGTTNPTEKLDVRGNIFLPSSSYITKQFTDGVEDLILRGYGGFGWVPWISYTPSAGTANRGYKLGAYSNDGTAATWYYLWNGGLGLGVTPQKPLHIYSPKVQADSSVIRLENEDRKWDINIKSGKLVLGDDTATADRITVDTSGNVGIGTINPEAKLDVRGTVKISEIQNVPTDTIFLSKPGDASRLWTVFSQGTGSYRFGMGAAPYDLQLWYGLNSTASSPGSQILTINSAGKIGINTASTPTTLHIRQHGDDDGITISHPTRTGVWKWSHSGVNSENFAFKQNNGTSDAVSYVMGRNLHNWSIDNNEVFKITGSQSVARTTYPFYTHNSAMEIRFDDYLAGSYFYGHGGHFFMKPFVRGETNITVDILTLSNLTTFSGNTIYLEIIAASATTQQGCIIDGYAYLQQSNGSGIYNTSAGLTKRYEWSTGIGNGTLSWNGLTLQYTTVSPSYTKYQIRAFVVCHDSSIVTTAR